MNVTGLFTTMFIHIAIGTICVFMFGGETKPSVLLNIGKEFETQGHHFWEAYVTQVSFAVLLICHIPFIFYSGKEGLLIIVDELNRKSISNALWHKLQGNKVFATESGNDNPPNEELPVPGDEEPYIEAMRKSQIETSDLKSS